MTTDWRNSRPAVPGREKSVDSRTRLLNSLLQMLCRYSEFTYEQPAIKPNVNAGRCRGNGSYTDMLFSVAERLEIVSSRP